VAVLVSPPLAAELVEVFDEGVDFAETAALFTGVRGLRGELRLTPEIDISCSCSVLVA
jgi:hypothetical protein